MGNGIGTGEVSKMIRGMERYNDGLGMVRGNSWGGIMVVVIVMVSTTVIVNGIDYLTVMETYELVGTILIFKISMIMFVIGNELVRTIMA